MTINTETGGLAREADHLREDFLNRLRPDERHTARRALETLAAEPVPSLEVGARAPDFELPNVHNRSVSLFDRLRKGPVVLSFFRGAWCSFCNLELRALQRRLPQIEALGATLLALSPESAEHSSQVAERHHLGYDILIDSDNRVARAYGLVAPAARFLTGFDERTAADPAKWNANNAADVPIPATYVVGTNATVAAAHVVGDWTRRMDPDEIIAVLREL